MIISVKPKKLKLTGYYRNIPIYNHLLLKVNSALVLIPALFNSGDKINVGNKTIEIRRWGGIIAKVKYENFSKVISVRNSIYSFKIDGMWTQHMDFPSVKFLMLYFSRSFSLSFEEFDKMFDTNFSQNKNEIISIMEAGNFTYFEVIDRNRVLLKNMELYVSDDYNVKILIDI